MSNENNLQTHPWLVCFILTLNFSFSLLTESSTIASIIGCFALGATACVSCETKCFAQFNFKKKNEDNKEILNNKEEKYEQKTSWKYRKLA